MGNSSSSDGSNTNTSGPNERRSSSNGRPSLTSRGLSHRITGGGSNNNAGGLSSSGFSLSLPSPFRTGGSLGLSKAELDARCQPSGLYPTCEWETKQIRRLISNGHLAARSKGYDGRMTKTDRECPICFMYYNETNMSKCCNATLCTECYLQIKPQKDKHTTCPFCNNPKMTISVQRGMDEGDVAKREEEEQKVIEATIMSRLNNLNGEHPATDGEGGGTDGSQHTAVSDGGSSFGSSLENYNRNRARTFSNTSSSGRSTGSGGEGIPGTPPPTRSRIMSEGSDASVIQSLAMSPDDRRALESEMREQLSHETHRRMESEAEEARSRHTQEWYESNAGMRSRVREARLAELTGLLERMGERGGAGNNADDEGESSLMAAAANEALGGGASLSRLLRAMEAASVSGGSSRNNTLEELMRLEAAFFVGNSESGPRGRRNQSLRSSARNRSGDNDNEEPRGRRNQSLRSSARRGLASNRGGMSSTHLDTAELLMRGVSEEEQLAMAIAMSMQDASEQQTSSTEQAEEDGGGNNQEGEETDQLDALQQPPLGDEEDSLSSESSSSSSDDSADEETNTNNDDNDRGEHNDEENDNSNDAVSLDENEEEVVFTDGA